MTDKIYMTTMPPATTVGFSQVMTIVQNKYIYSGERARARARARERERERKKKYK